jgi:hypothetical protein
VIQYWIKGFYASRRIEKLHRYPAMLAKFSLDTPRSKERLAMYAAQRRRL